MVCKLQNATFQYKVNKSTESQDLASLIKLKLCKWCLKQPIG